MPIHLPRTLRSSLTAWASAGYPAEVCGTLIGSKTESTVRIDDVTLARNLNHARAQDRYELDPEDFLRSDMRARGLGLDIVGIWHTHPDHPARPSATDRDGAWDEWVYLILSVKAGKVADTRAWRLDGERFAEERVLP